MTRLDISLTFPGTAEEAFRFYRQVFGGELQQLIRYDDDSMKDMGIPDKDRDKAAYVRLDVGGDILEADDTLEMNGPAPAPGTIMSIVVRTETREEAARIFRALSEGGTVTLPLEDQFWGAFYGSLRDRFGVNWVLRYDYPAKPG